MKTAEFLNTKANYMLQVLPEHAGDDPESGLVKVPEGAVAYIRQKGVWSGFIINMKFVGCAEIIWQRTTLQQKVDEVRQHLGITNNNILSVMIGREKSYLRKLLKRNASSATVEKVIAELDALIDSQSDKMADADSCRTIGTASGGSIGLNLVEESLITANLKLKNGLLQNEIRGLNQKLKLSNDVAEMWDENYKRSSKLNVWLFLIIILFIGLLIAWWAL